jgi:SPP1 family phage portal protein
MAINAIDRILGYEDIYDPIVQKEFYEMLSNGEESREQIISWIMQVDSKRRNIQYGQFKRLKGEKARKFEWDDPRMADGVPIYARTNKNKVKVNHKSHTAFDRAIVTNKKSYILGKTPTITGSDSFLQWLQDNHFYTVLSEVGEDAIGQGEGFILLYSPPSSNQAFLTKEQSYTCAMIYNPDTNLPEYGLIYTFSKTEENGTKLQAYFYDRSTVTEYTGSGKFFSSDNDININTFNVTRESDPEPHLFTGVPLIEWRNNSERISDTEPVLGLMDLYDIMDSDLLSELSQLRLAYMFFKNMGLDDQAIQQDESTDQLLEHMQEAGILVSENENAEADFISKQTNYEAVQYAKQSLKERIFQMANSYDPVTIQGSESNVTAFQIRMKLFPLEQSSIETETWFTESFMYMVDLLQGFYSDFGTGFTDETEIIFHRNIPKNTVQDIKDARASGYMISQKQLARLLSLDIDQEENEKELQEEQESLFLEPEEGLTDGESNTF